MVIQENEWLLRECEEAVRKNSGSVTEACKMIAGARNKQGYELSSQLLEKLIEGDRAGKLPGRTSKWLNCAIKGKVSKELKRDLREIDRHHQQSIGDVIGVALAAYEQE